MEQKDMYTLKELYGELKIPLAELGRRSGISEVTVAKIRDGASARRSTINSLLEAFAEIYKIKLSISTVSDIVIKDKLARAEETAKSQSSVTEKGTVPSELTLTSDSTPAIPSPQNRPTMAKKDIVSETSPKKRTYKPRDTGLPDGAILALDFARNHGREERTFRDDMLIGLGQGLIHGPDVDETTQMVKDYVRYEERNKRVRKDGTIEKERYLTADQQHQALLFWQRHSIGFSECDRALCRCHDMLQS